MKYIKDDIWKYHDRHTPIVITTNGYVKRNGECVMGRGIALQCKTRFPEFPAILGEKIKVFGNHVYFFEGYLLITFPVKHNWWEMADLGLIALSCEQLLEFMKKLEDENRNLKRRLGIDETY